MMVALLAVFALFCVVVKQKIRRTGDREEGILHIVLFGIMAGMGEALLCLMLWMNNHQLSP